MKVELTKSFPIGAPSEVAWDFLQNIEAVAGCMPGAKITERLPTGSYKGTVAVRVGPAAMSFRGEVEVRDVDPAAHSLRLLAKGTDTTGTSGATMDLAARIEAVTEGACNLVGESVVSMSGKAAAFGGRMMNSVADQVLKQFADNFTAQVTALAAQRSAVAVAAPIAQSTAAAMSESPGAAAPSPPSPAVASELNGLALLWSALKHWLRGLFRKKAL